MAEKPGFAKEADLCAAFIDAVRKGGLWTAYAETAGFDIVLVRNEDGAQIGVEAKLRLNAKVLTQALPDWFELAYDRAGPDYRAVLIPEGRAGDLQHLCSALGVTVIRFRGKERGIIGALFRPDLPRVHGADPDRFFCGGWHEWCPTKRLALPDYVPDVRAGESAPLALTFWKVQAIKLAIILKDRPVTRADFKLLNLSPSRWTDPYSGWLKRTPGGYVPGPNMPDFAAMHPRNYAEIEADRQNWEHPEPPRQIGLPGVAG